MNPLGVDALVGLAILLLIAVAAGTFAARIFMAASRPAARPDEDV